MFFWKKPKHSLIAILMIFLVGCATTTPVSRVYKTQKGVRMEVTESPLERNSAIITSTTMRVVFVALVIWLFSSFASKTSSEDQQ